MADTEPTDKTADDGKSTPPWGDDFNAERAWSLITNLREEKATLKSERDAFKVERDENARKLQESATGDKDADEKIKDAIERAAKAEKELYVERALRKFPDIADYAEFLSGDDEEAILAKAEKLASIGKPKDADADKDADVSRETDADKDADADTDGHENPGAGLPGKPTPSLSPGHGGDETPAFDPVAIAKAARR
ncbi:scaffolding protein [Arthrobacter phage VroomVroom]|uniref:Scaffolding protein n=1 Tax=Arthrobacter phage VroomVroom TaxID=3049371 RepID=A0AA49F9K5_9CAUD|nr:scaffolding protein [Arthrobacter phage VroomVroom]